MAILGVKGGTDGIPNMIFTVTETWQPAKTIQAYVYVVGGGGSGAGGGSKFVWLVEGVMATADPNSDGTAIFT